MPIKINGATSGSTTITAPATGSDETIELSTALASKLPYSYGTATPSTTDSGFLWYDSNSTPPVPKYWDGSAFETLAPAPGLELITTETFSAVSSVSVNGCFSASYRNYLIVGEPETSGNVIIHMRMRVSGSDDTATSYVNTTVGLMSNGSFENIAGGLVNTWSLCRAGRGFLLNVMNPFATDRTTLHGAAHGTNAASTLNAGFTINSEFVSTTSFDGFSIYPASGTITGFLRIYGYKD